MATAWEELGSYSRAIRHLLICLQRDEDPHVRTVLGSCHARMGCWPEAVVEYKKALASWPHPTVLLALAEAKIRLGDFKEARELTDTAERDHSPLDPEVQESLRELRDELQTESSQSLDRKPPLS